VKAHGCCEGCCWAKYNMVNQSYILKWYDGESPRFQCFLRGVREDGSFYGEVTAFPAVSQCIDGIHGSAANVDGVLSPADSLRFKELVAGIEVARQGVTDNWTGLLAEGPISNPRIIFRYMLDDDEQSPESQAFLTITRLFEPYLRPSYPKVT